MDITKLKRIFDFLEAKENKIPKYKRTLTWKIMLNYPLTEEDLNFKGNLDLYKSKIKSLPKGLKISGNLTLYKTKITSLPEGLEVGGNLDLKYQTITTEIYQIINELRIRLLCYYLIISICVLMNKEKNFVLRDMTNSFY